MFRGWQAPDYAEYVERTEPIRQRQIVATAFDVDDDALERKVRDVIEELEFLIDNRATMGNRWFREGVKEQVIRLIG